MSSNALTLYESEAYLNALLETDGSVPEEQEREFQLELNRALASAADKREAVGRFILAGEAAARFRRDEAKRMIEAAWVIENGIDRLRQYVAGYIASQPPDAKGKPVKLSGHTLTMSVRACPASVEITDAATVPAEFTMAEIIMKATKWKRILCSIEPSIFEELRGTEVSFSPDRHAIKAAMERGEAVPGADLVIGRKTLVVK